MKRYFIILVMVWASWTLRAQDQPLFVNDVFSVFPRKVVQAEHHAQVAADNALTSTFEHREWLLKNADKGGLPTFSCNIPLSNAMHNLSLDELCALVEKDSIWHTAPGQQGIGTRELGYGSLLGLSYLYPRVTEKSLMSRVNGWRVLQDAGTGGSWPVSTDRALWVLAAWQHYLVTGDKGWLKRSYDVVRSTLMQDEATLFDESTGLVKGESSYLDSREQSYPRWMQPADIAMSQCLSTNAIFYRANVIAARMATLLGDKNFIPVYQARADKIKAGINQHLWLEDKGYYGQYLYGREFPIVSPRSETLGEALCIIFGIADEARARRIVSSVALTPWGTPCFNPQIPNIYPYHNNAIWPFVEAYWMWASAKAGNQQAVVHSMASIYRTASIFATNQQNVDATLGGLNTAKNSRGSILSAVGNLSVAHKILIGVDFVEQGLAVRPFVPKDWTGQKRLTMRYRKALLEIVVEGYGDKIAGFYVDGKRQKEPIVSGSITGKHKVRVVMADGFNYQEAAKFGPVTTSLETVPQVYFEGRNMLAWHPVMGAVHYKILRNGQLLTTRDEQLNGNRLAIGKASTYTEYQVIAVDKDGNESFASEPLAAYDGNEMWLDMVKFGQASHSSEVRGYTGTGAVEVSATANQKITIPLRIESDGIYRIDFRYANGSESPSASDQCAARTLWLTDADRQICIGQVVMPQRGKDLWDAWGMSNGLDVYLPAGEHTLLMTLGPENENMNNQGVNKALIDAIRLVKVEK